MLTDEQAAIVKGLLARGEKQQDIAAFFGENQARVNDVKSGKTHKHVVPAQFDRLPTGRQMLPSGYIVMQMRMALSHCRAAVDQALMRLDDIEQAIAHRRDYAKKPRKR